jgi:hypothetical protein
MAFVASSSAALLRASSPAVSTSVQMQALSLVDASDESKAHAAAVARHARHVLLGGASTVEELIAMIPPNYRVDLSAHCKSIAALCGKKIACQATLDKWRAHKAAGTYPSHIHSRFAETQVSSIGVHDVGVTAAIAALVKSQTEALVDALDLSIAVKEADLKALEAKLEPTAIYRLMADDIKSRTKVIVEKSRIPVFTQIPDAPAGESDISGWLEDEALKDMGRDVLEDAVFYGYRVIAIIEAATAFQNLRFKKKAEIAKDADIEMADVNVKDGPSLSKLIDAQLERRGFGPKKAPASKGKGKARDHSHPHSGSNLFSLVLGQEAGWQEEGALVQARPTRQEAGRSQAQKGQDRQEEGRQQRQEVGEDARVTFRYGRLSTYPDALLTMPHLDAVQWIILNTPLDIVNAARFKHYVHVSPGVNLPQDIAYQLSVGMKYMFHNRRNTQLISDAWKDFENRIRWRLFFSFTYSNASEHDYDPDYEVPHVTKQGPSLPEYLERGLMRGSDFVRNTIRKIPDEDENTVFKAHAPSRRQIEEFLISNDYVVTNTDKNLGIAVSGRTWVREKCLELLSDRDNYVPIDRAEMQFLNDEKCTEMNLLADYAEVELRHPQLAKFLRHLVTEPGSEHKNPMFYGIPKIHKEPVKMRPIVPCHSAIQNPAAKYISKKLKPLIKAAPTIIHGSKDLAIKLSQVKLQPGRKLYIVTGDVVAFYPNVPLNHCLDVVTQLYEEFMYGDEGATTDEELHDMIMFIRCLNISNENLVMQFEDSFYKQKQGLAMGVAAAPDLANLYGWHHERQAMILRNPLVPFYGRYIDDCAALVYAYSEKEAIRTVSDSVRFDGCTIEWNASDSHQIFLDMRIYIDKDGNVQHMPYRKSRSHQERIPWISHHPLDVKRGTFIGEMSRLATLCSLRSHYIDAIRGLSALYIQRGYPQDLVLKWISDNVTDRWSKRLNISTKSDEPAEGVLVLKSTFNSAWNFFNAKELGETVLGYWRNYCVRAENDSFNIVYPKYSHDLHGLKDRLDPEFASLFHVRTGLRPMPDIRKIDILNRRMIVSRKRNRNLFDLTSLWKKTVFAKLEHDIQAPDQTRRVDNPHDNVSHRDYDNLHRSDRKDDDDVDPAHVFL